MKIMYKNIALLLVVSLFSFLISCEEVVNTTTLTQAEKEDQIIRDYLADQGITEYQSTTSGIYYRYLEENATAPHPGDNRVYDMGYTGQLLYGDIFDSSILREDTFNVEIGTGRIYNGMVETEVAALDTSGGREFDTVMCTSYSGSVIAGWVAALDIIKEHERMEFYIPSQLAYGSVGSGLIPPNTPIKFEMVTYNVNPIFAVDDRCTSSN